MNKKNATSKSELRKSAGHSWWAMPAALVITLAASPAQAGFAIPDAPLTMATRVAPNIMFILDDSGSMASEGMPDRVPGFDTSNTVSCFTSTSASNPACLAYTRNTLAYNPATTYQPWLQADGTRMTGGASYSQAYGSYNKVGGTTIDIGSDSSCVKYNQNDNETVDEPGSGASGTRRCGGVQTFYVPKDPTNISAAYRGALANYYRYQIRAGGTDIQRGVWGAIVATSTTSPATNVAVSPATGSVARYATNTHSLGTVTAGNTLTIAITETGNQRSGTYVVYAPDGSQACSGSFSAGNTTSCTVNSTAAGEYSVQVTGSSSRGSSTANYSLAASYVKVTRTYNSCDPSQTSGNGWINCVSALPNSSRTLAEELVNYATWFSYYRTRTKAAKAGASDAFSALDSKVRVGFRTIWNRDNLDIPVNDGNDGRFVDTPAVVGTSTTPAIAAINSRSNWFSRLFDVISYNGTPLHGALDSAGNYFSDTSATGPYGPESGANQFACRQNFTILTTDGYWNNDSNYTGTFYTPRDGNGNQIDVSSWTRAGVGDQDNTAGSTITGPNSQSYTYSPAAPYSGSDADTLADVAMKYWKNDLRTDMANVVPTSTLDPAFWQHMVTFGISIGLSGSKGWKSVSEVPQSATWNNPNDWEDGDRIDDLLHAAVNGRGAFVAASNPVEFSNGLTGALAAIAERTSSYSNVAANSVSLSSGSQVFSASYVSGKWTGNLTARAITESGVASNATWTASIPAWASRKVFTISGNSGTTFPTAAQITSLARTGGASNYAVSGSDNADYIKGNQTLEGTGLGKLRVRTSLLGDIVGSSPAYVEDTDTLYVGANDGMLHAFNASTGVELFAYVPGIVNLSNLARLSRGDYGHKFLVDGPVVVSSRDLTPNQNILVGTLGRGGKGVYALDVTNANTPAATMAKWERSETTGGNMGNILSEPLFAKTADSSTAVMFGNGVNSTNNKAVLLVLDASTGSVIREIDTGEGSATAPNGLSAVTGVLGPDGVTMSYAYAGDMLGNVWKFDLTSATPANWTATKLFTASTVDANGNTQVQPISGGVTVATDPATLKRWVFFGTGSFLTSADANTSNSVTQGMYGIIDSDELVAKSDLKERGFSVTSDTSNGFPVRAFDDNAPMPSDKKGWYVNLPESGERIVQDAQMAGGFLVTASMTPVGSGCGADGSGYINAIDAFTGTAAKTSFFDLNGDGTTEDSAVTGGKPVGSVNMGNGMPTLPNLMRGGYVVGGTGGGLNFGKGKLLWKRMSWREFRKD